ncbi:MAG: hypothetical protein M1838_006232 [Thelocarpon superellum]|nr:MAG: hypothetical protein M1838_006232 [Thelocarpon superellum]
MTRLVKPGPPSMPGISATHTAGIYADMTVDGPEIGDLVVILDKAKNLPNRKTIGKQDPYCAARLGKEAKKTQTDKRGGQTPKWDQELRFTVHDSPDYYQLKVSVFNDDKKTDLIGEAWVSLESVVVRGGGRSDGWHALNCKGRYAGEIRMELTYYDIRPKEDRRQELRKETARDSPERDTVGGPRQLKPIKRRPLPNDPVHTPSAPSSMALPDPAGPLLNAHMQPRAYPEPPEYQLRTAPNMAGYPSPAPSPHHSQPPSAMDHQSAWDPESPYDPALSGQHTMVLAPLQPMDDYAPYNAFPANNNMTQQPHGRSYGVAGRRHSGDAMTSSFHEDAQYMPPSLIPGYDPIVAADLSHRNFQERQAGWRRRSEMPAQANASFQPSARVFRHSQSHYDLSSKASASTFPSEEGSIRHAHRSSAPMFRPQAVSPGARSPLRASISPAAPSMPEEASLSGMPFSPDAYDAFNPKARTSSTSNRSGRSSATGRVPDAPLVDSRDASRGSTDEPIRGSDGRLIDPSDHLPADTWAPEPERKMAHKARSRHSPQGAQPMPASGRRPARDHPARSSMMATPTYVQHDEDPQMASPSGNTTRNRLQKRIRAHASSPALATSSAGGSFGSRSTAPRSSATEYPLRERENYGSVYLPASPPYQDGARSSLSGPPPVPAKVPMKAGRDDLSALSEELSTISIGSGARRAARRVHY